MIKKRLMLQAFYVLVIFMFVACSAPMQEFSDFSKLLQATDSFSVQAEGLYFSAVLSNDGEAYELSFPNELCGLKLTRSNEGLFSAEYRGVKTYLPASALSVVSNFGATVSTLKEQLMNGNKSNVTKNGNALIFDFKDCTVTICATDKKVTEIIFEDGLKTTNYKILTEENKDEKQSRGED